MNEKWCSEQELPKHYLKRCQDLFRQTQNYDESRNHVRCLFSKGILLLVNSCRPSSSDRVQSACLKLLYLADLFYKRFKKMIVTDKELVSQTITVILFFLLLSTLRCPSLPIFLSPLTYSPDLQCRQLSLLFLYSQDLP